MNVFRGTLFVMLPRAAAVAVALGSAAVACAGGSKEAAAPSPEAPDGGVGVSGSADSGSDAGRPFATSAAEATQLISEAVDKKQAALAKCVQAYRFRNHLAHEKVSVQIAIDQEGRVIGATVSKGKQDKELAACAQEELRDAVFPRSRAGVVTITRSFEELVK